MADPINCPSCGSTVKIDAKKDILFCPYCGMEMPREHSALDKMLEHRQKVVKAKEKTKVDIQRQKEETKRKRSKRDTEFIAIMIGFFIMVVVIIVCMTIMKLSGK